MILSQTLDSQASCLFDDRASLVAEKRNKMHPALETQRFK